MVTFSTVLLKFDAQGEKTGWTYIEVPSEVTQELIPGQRKSFRVKGRLDDLAIKSVALLPMGEGAFILPVNAQMRKVLRKKEGASVHAELTLDNDPLPPSVDLLACLEDESKALAFFEQLPKGHQNYYTRWIESARTPETKANRITKAIRGLTMGMGFGEMIRYFKSLKDND